MTGKASNVTRLKRKKHSENLKMEIDGNIYR